MKVARGWRGGGRPFPFRMHFCCCFSSFFCCSLFFSFSFFFLFSFSAGRQIMPPLAHCRSPACHHRTSPPAYRWQDEAGKAVVFEHHFAQPRLHVSPAAAFSNVSQQSAGAHVLLWVLLLLVWLMLSRVLAAIGVVVVTRRRAHRRHVREMAMGDNGVSGAFEDEPARNVGMPMAHATARGALSMLLGVQMSAAAPAVKSHSATSRCLIWQACS